MSCGDPWKCTAANPSYSWSETCNPARCSAAAVSLAGDIRPGVRIPRPLIKNAKAQYGETQYGTHLVGHRDSCFSCWFGYEENVTDGTTVLDHTTDGRHNRWNQIVRSVSCGDLAVYLITPSITRTKSFDLSCCGPGGIAVSWVGVDGTLPARKLRREGRETYRAFLLYVLLSNRTHQSRATGGARHFRSKKIVRPLFGHWFHQCFLEA